MTVAPITAPKRPSRRWLRIVVWTLSASCLALAGFYFYSDFATNKAWAEAEAEAARDLPRWRLHELEADRRQVPDAENSALHVVAVSRKGARMGFTIAPRYDDIVGKLPHNVAFNAQQIELFREAKATIVKPLEEARKLKDMRYGRLWLNVDDDYQEIMNTLVPAFQNARHLGDWLPHDAYLRAHDGDMDGAVESCRALVNAARAMGDEPSISAFLVRIALQHIALDCLERVLAQGEPGEKALEEMQALLEVEMKECIWLHALRRERALIYHLFENVRSGKVKSDSLSQIGFSPAGAGGNPIRLWILDKFPRTILKYYPEYLQHTNRIIEVARLPRHDRAAELEQIESLAKDSSNPFVRLDSRGAIKTQMADCRSQIFLGSATAALACERYRLKHADWPATLDVLVKDGLLASVPLDPMDGEPLRYRRTRAGIVVYSVGMDKKDDGGNIDLERFNQPGVDMGFRLWNVNQRRLPPRPPINLDAP